MADNRREDLREHLSEELPRDQEQSGIPVGGRPAGGGAGPSDMGAAGGSSGSGGYGNAQNQQFHQGQQDRTLSGGRSDPKLDRGERFDEQQGGGRGPDAVSPDEDEVRRERGVHQDRGQSIAEAEAENR